MLSNTCIYIHMSQLSLRSCIRIRPCIWIALQLHHCPIYFLLYLLTFSRDKSHRHYHYTSDCVHLRLNVWNGMYGYQVRKGAIIARRVKNHSIRMLTDSMSILQALSSYYSTHQDIQNNHVTLQWIKGNKSSLGNDATDILTRKGSETDAVRSGSHSVPPLPMGKNNYTQKYKISVTKNNFLG